MTITNFNRKRFHRGMTFIEALAVVAIISLILAGAASPFVQTLKAYKNQYVLEGAQVEAQRAVAEFEYYGYRAVYFTTATNTASFFFDTGESYVFTFNQGAGTLSLTTPVGSYTYRGTWALPSGVTSAFYIKPDGIVLTLDVLTESVPMRVSAFVPVKSL